MQKVLDQIDGKGIAPVCAEGPEGIWDGTSTYFNAPFSMDVSLRDTSLAGRYTDQHDTGYVWGTYTGGGAIVMNVNFGDGGLFFNGEFDGPDKIKGTLRATYVSGVFPFTMVRRP
jgi:hypothetical protein